jgi:hypothetical protein
MFESRNHSRSVLFVAYANGASDNFRVMLFCSERITEKPWLGDDRLAQIVTAFFLDDDSNLSGQGTGAIGTRESGRCGRSCWAVDGLATKIGIPF